MKPKNQYTEGTMPSKNSYTYYNRFLMCLERYLKKKVDDNKKHNEKYNYTNDPYILSTYDNGKGQLGVESIFRAFVYIFDDLIKKAPSATMGGDDWLDKFFINTDGELCPGMWCGNERCQNYNGGYPYYCQTGMIPGKCEKWKTWRLSWRSYPENGACQKCKHYKPDTADMHYRSSSLQLKQINEYKCYCRAKELPENCPKKKKGEK
jgi:hypothetical protein